MNTSIKDPSLFNKQFAIRWTPHREYGLSVSIIDRSTKKKVAYATGGGYDKLQDALMQFFKQYFNMTLDQERSIERQCEGWSDKEHKIEELFKALGFANSYSNTLRNWNGKPAKNTYYFAVRP